MASLAHELNSNLSPFESLSGLIIATPLGEDRMMCNEQQGLLSKCSRAGQTREHLEKYGNGRHIKG